MKGIKCWLWSEKRKLPSGNIVRTFKFPEHTIQILKEPGGWIQVELTSVGEPSIYSYQQNLYDSMSELRSQILWFFSLKPRRPYEMDGQ